MLFSAEAVVQRCSLKEVLFEISQNSQEILAQGSSYEFCEISKNTFSYRTPPVATSVSVWSVHKLESLLNKVNENLSCKFLSI